MLGPGRYLLGVVEILLLGGFAWLGGRALRRWLLTRLEGAPAALATAVIALALLIWPAELLGTFSAFDPMPYLALVAAVGLGCWKFAPRAPERGETHLAKQAEVRAPSLRQGQRRDSVPILISLGIAVLAAVHFAGGVKTRLSTGMTGFDSTWYHGPVAAGFFQSGNTWDLHFIAPQFLAWFYPANSEILHAVGMLAFGRDILSPLLNLGWFVGCLIACWCIGRPYRAAPWSLALGAIALSVPALFDQAGEARNDIVGIFFLLAAVALAVNAWAGREAQAGEGLDREGGVAGVGAYLVIGLAAGLAAGTKLNFLLPAAALVVGLGFVGAAGRSSLRPAGTTAFAWRPFAAAALAALAGGGYWYLRNLAHTGNPLPWIHHLGPIGLPAPRQTLGGREAHSVLGYLTDRSVWSNWFLPGLHHALWMLWPLLIAAAVTGLLLALAAPVRRRAELSPPFRRGDEKSTPKGHIGPSGEEGGHIGPSAAVMAVAGAVGLASALAWLVAPTSASGPEGMPRGFESGLRYLAPALVLGLSLLPAVLPEPLRLGAGPSTGRMLKTPSHLARRLSGRGVLPAIAASVLLVAVAIGYPIQRRYLADRYKDPTFTTSGLNAAFAWSRSVSEARIATTSTRQYPLYGTDLSNEVQYLGIHRPHGGFEPPTTCRQYLQLLSDGNYDYVIASKDRLEPGKPPYPPLAKWLGQAGAKIILRKPPTVVFQLHDHLGRSACR